MVILQYLIHDSGLLYRTQRKHVWSVIWLDARSKWKCNFFLLFKASCTFIFVTTISIQQLSSLIAGKRKRLNIIISNPTDPIQKPIKPSADSFELRIVVDPRVLRPKNDERIGRKSSHSKYREDEFIPFEPINDMAGIQGKISFRAVFLIPNNRLSPN